MGSARVSSNLILVESFYPSWLVKRKSHRIILSDEAVKSQQDRIYNSRFSLLILRAQLYI